MGPIVALTFGDGFMRTIIASEALDAGTWDLHSELQLDTSSKPCTCLSWRERDATLPPLLVVGCAAGHVEVCVFHVTTLRWEIAISLGDKDEDYGGQPISAVSWAPSPGRPNELVAVACGRRVIVWALYGAIDHLRVERVASLEHDHHVWQLGWNMMGTWLAASTEGEEVCLWRPDLAGEWLLMNKITGGDVPKGDIDLIS